MDFLKPFLMMGCCLGFLQATAQQGYRPVSKMNLETYQDSVSFPQEGHFVNRVSGKRVNVLHSLENSGMHFYNSVSFKDPDKGIIAGGVGLRIRTTTDGGHHWQDVSFSRFANALYSTAILHGNYFVVGASRYIFKSANGKTWQGFDVAQLAQTKYGLRHPKFYKIRFLPSGFGLVMGRNGGAPILLKTDDHGKSWQRLSSKGMKAGERLVSDAVIFPDHTIRAVTSKGSVYQHTKGAGGWTLLHHGKKNESLNAIAFKNKQTGYVSGFDRLLLKTDDGGKTWKKIGVEALSYKANITNLAYLANGKLLLTTAEGYGDRKFDTFVYTLNRQGRIAPVILKKTQKEGKDNLPGDAYGLCILKNRLLVLCRDKLYETAFSQNSK